MIDDAGRVVHDRHFPFPVARVWDAIANADAIAQWLMPNDFEPTVGHRFQLDAGPPRGLIDAEVVELDAPHRMVWRWVLDGVDTLVTITLLSVEGGTRLHLEHAAIPDETRPKFDSGWPEKFDALTKLLEATP